MRFSPLKEIRTRSLITDVFGGYNHNIRISESEFYDMKNMSSAHFPVLSPRNERGVKLMPTSGTHKLNGLIDKDGLCYVDNTDLYIADTKVSGFELTNTPKQLISMGAYIIIMPDKKYINTKDLTDFGNIEASYTSTGTVTYELCRVDGTAYTNVTVSATPPSNPTNQKLWIDTSTSPHTLKQYSSAGASWVAIPTTYVKIKSTNIGASFSKLDGVKLSGIVPTQLASLEGKTSVLQEVYHDTVNSGRDDYIVVVGLIDSVTTQSTPLTALRQMPIMDFIIESENRLWGCRYGLDVNGNIVNEIYASKLGDFRNWNSFLGISTDSYVASCGTDGPFTGAITHLGYPLFFKENCMHKVYGNYPSNYQIQTMTCRGVQKGCGNSLAVVNEKLFYKSRNGICVYDGSLPTEVSEALGEIKYTGVDTSISADPLRCGAVAGSHQNAYYISMKSEVDGEWYMFVFDTSKGLWIKEDETRVDAFCSSKGELYFIEHNIPYIKTVGSDGRPNENVSWMVESGMLCAEYPTSNSRDLSKKYISRLDVRMSMEAESVAMFYIQYDSHGEWEHIASLTGTSTRTFALPIRPKRCDHFRLKIEGRGNVNILAYTKTIEEGGQ